MGGLPGRWFFFLTLGAFLLSLPITLLSLEEDTAADILLSTLEVAMWVSGPCMAAWILGYLGLTYIPEEHLEKPSRKGPVWEIVVV